MGKYIMCCKALVSHLPFTRLVGHNESVVAIQGWRGGLGNTNTLRMLMTP